MNVRILTFHQAANYGAVLQALGLAQAVAACGHDVEVIDYRTRSCTAYYLKEAIKYGRAGPGLLKMVKFAYFANRELPLTRKTVRRRGDLPSTLTNVEAVIAGSDQIWHIGGFRGFAPEFFLDFVETPIRRVAYAASFGSTEQLGDRDKEIGNLIRRFDFISARDANTQNLLSSLGDVRSQLVLDPSFLGDYSPFIEESNVLRKASPYMVIYAQIPEAYESSVKAFANKHGLRIISVGYRTRIADENHVAIGPREWLAYLAGSSFVLTTYYHGLLFSLILKKPFVVIHTSSKSVKTNDVIRRYGLDQQLIDSPSRLTDGDVDLFKIDYSRIDRAIEHDRRISIDYLVSALS